MSIKKLVPELVTLVIIVIGAFCFPLVSYGLRFTPPFLFSALRTSLASLSIILILPLLKQPIFPPKSTWKWVLLLSLPAVVITYGTMFLSHTNPKMTAVPVLENLQPFLSVFLAVIFLQEKVSEATKKVLIFGTIGILFLSIQAALGGVVLNATSTTLALLASLSAASASVMAKRIKRPDMIVTLSAWQYIIGSIPLLIISLLFERNSSAQFTLPFLGILLFLAVVGTAATTVVWYLLLQKTTVSRLSVLYFLSPAFGLVFANLAFGTTITVLEWLAILSIISGVFLGLRKQTQINN